MPTRSPPLWQCIGTNIMFAFLALAASPVAGTESAPLWPPPPERVALLPPVEFSLEESHFAGEPIADADPEPLSMPRGPRRGSRPFGAAAPVSIGGFWAPSTDVVGQPAVLGMNAQFARIAAPILPPSEGSPIWIGIGRFGHLELSTDAVLPDSHQPVPDQLWLVETGVTHIRPLASGGTLGGTFLFGSASDRPFAAGRDLTLMAIGFWTTPARNDRDEWNLSVFYSPTSQLPYPLPGIPARGCHCNCCGADEPPPTPGSDHRSIPTSSDTRCAGHDLGTPTARRRRPPDSARSTAAIADLGLAALPNDLLRRGLVPSRHLLPPRGQQGRLSIASARLHSRPSARCFAVGNDQIARTPQRRLNGDQRHGRSPRRRWHVRPRRRDAAAV